jgi:aspartate carbamoyltransferase catalytic subunit
MKLKHILEAQQFDKDFLFSLFKSADDLRKIHDSEILKGKIMAVLFYEPSTRTRLSFESAMLKLGGQVIGTENAKEFSSASKGESMEDTIRVISKYADCIVIRHSVEGTAKVSAEVSSVPIINGGDGKGQHPTQALLDMYTIYREFGRLGNLKVAVVGDLANGRTARSLCYLLSEFPGNEITFVSPENLKMGQDIKDHLKEHNIDFKEEIDLNKVLPEMDVIYMTRIQKERMSVEDYDLSRGKYIINEENINLLKESGRVLHPLPHVEEIDLKIHTEKENPRVAYFRQAEDGLYIRMALLKLLLS